MEFYIKGGSPNAKISIAAGAPENPATTEKIKNTEIAVNLVFDIAYLPL